MSECLYFDMKVILKFIYYLILYKAHKIIRNS
jgi:hypothetical protein